MYIYMESRREMREKEVHAVSEETMAEAVSQLTKDIDVYIQEPQRISNIINKSSPYLCSNVAENQRHRGTLKSIVGKRHLFYFQLSSGENKRVLKGSRGRRTAVGPCVLKSCVNVKFCTQVKYSSRAKVE